MSGERALPARVIAHSEFGRSLTDSGGRSRLLSCGATSFDQGLGLSAFSVSTRTMSATCVIVVRMPAVEIGDHGDGHVTNLRLADRSSLRMLVKVPMTSAAP